jgi:hypothetical protein
MTDRQDANKVLVHDSEMQYVIEPLHTNPPHSGKSRRAKFGIHHDAIDGITHFNGKIHGGSGAGFGIPATSPNVFFCGETVEADIAHGGPSR